MLNQTPRNPKNLMEELISNLTTAVASYVEAKTRRLFRTLILNAFFLRWYVLLAIPVSIDEPSQAEEY